MSYQNPKRPVHIDSYENNGNLLNPSKKYVKNARPVAESCFRGDYELVTTNW